MVYQSFPILSASMKTLVASIKEVYNNYILLEPLSEKIIRCIG